MHTDLIKVRFDSLSLLFCQCFVFQKHRIDMYHWRPDSCKEWVWSYLTQWDRTNLSWWEFTWNVCIQVLGVDCWLVLNACVYVYFSSSSCLQIVLHHLRVVPLQMREAQTEACWKKPDWLKTNQNCMKKTVKTALCARMAQWTGCSCPAGTRACAMAALSIFSSVPCVGSLFKSLSHSAVKRSKMKMNQPRSRKMFILEEFFNGDKNKRIGLYAPRLNVENRLFMGGYLALTCTVLLFTARQFSASLCVFAPYARRNIAFLCAMWTEEVRRTYLKDGIIFIASY